MSTAGDLPTMPAWPWISNRRIRMGCQRCSGSPATEFSGRCLAITGTCTWSNNDRATSRHRRGRAKWSVTRRRDHKAANVSAGKTRSNVESAFLAGEPDDVRYPTFAAFRSGRPTRKETLTISSTTRCAIRETAASSRSVHKCRTVSSTSPSSTTARHSN